VAAQRGDDLPRGHIYTKAGIYVPELAVVNVCGVSSVSDTLKVFYSIYLPVVARIH